MDRFIDGLFVVGLVAGVGLVVTMAVVAPQETAVAVGGLAVLGALAYAVGWAMERWRS